MDAVAAGMIFMVLSSLYMWWELPQKRVPGAVALGLGSLICGLFCVGLRWVFWRQIGFHLLQKTARDDEGLAGNPGRIAGCEKQRHGSDVLRLTGFAPLRSAMGAPIPFEAPVTTATRPVSFLFSVFIVSSFDFSISKVGSRRQLRAAVI